MIGRKICENKNWYMDAVESSLILRGMTRDRARDLIKQYDLRGRLDAFPELQLHYDVEVTADEIMRMVGGNRRP